MALQQAVRPLQREKLYCRQCGRLFFVWRIWWYIDCCRDFCQHVDALAGRDKIRGPGNRSGCVVGRLCCCRKGKEEAGRKQDCGWSEVSHDVLLFVIDDTKVGGVRRAHHMMMWVGDLWSTGQVWGRTGWKIWTDRANDSTQVTETRIFWNQLVFYVISSCVFLLFKRKWLGQSLHLRHQESIRTWKK